MGENWRMTDYNLDRIDIIENYIRNPTVDFFYDHVVNIQDNIVLVVDWREVDEAIIRYCENILQTVKKMLKLYKHIQLSNFYSFAPKR